jgi:hypothetical protein
MGLPQVSEHAETVAEAATATLLEIANGGQAAAMEADLAQAVGFPTV